MGDINVGVSPVAVGIAIVSARNATRDTLGHVRDVLANVLTNNSSNLTTIFDYSARIRKKK